jgi:hypothetical protein
LQHGHRFQSVVRDTIKSKDKEEEHKDKEEVEGDEVLKEAEDNLSKNPLE